MGNQEAKQRRANGSCMSVEEGWREGEKKSGKHGVRGVHGAASGKKKNKLDAKSSVFSLRKKKGHLKGKGDAGLGSKEDILSSQHVDPDNKTPDLSADELGQSDTESALSGKKQQGELKQDLQQTSATTDHGGSKGAGNSGSDTDIHSFHSADDHDDLLADIQRVIQLQHQQQKGEMDPQKEEDWKMTLVKGEERTSDQLSPPELLDLTPELEVGSDALSFLELATESEQRELTIQRLPLLTDKSKEKEEESNWESESSLCVTTGTKDQHALLQQPISIIPVTIATSLNSSVPLPGEEDHRKTKAELSPKGPEQQTSAGREPPGISTSTESVDDHVCPKVEANRSSPSCRRHGMSVSPLTNPRSTSSSSSPVVKPYPSIIPSYIKTTTRQLSSPGHSPICSPFHSPLTPLRGQHYLYR